MDKKKRDRLEKDLSNMAKPIFWALFLFGCILIFMETINVDNIKIYGGVVVTADF